MTGKTRMRNVIRLSYILLLCVTAAQSQSPWLQQQGRLYTQFSVNYIPKYNELYLNGGNTIKTERDLQDITLQAWLEWGVLESTNVMLNLPIKVFTSADETNYRTFTGEGTQAGDLTALGNIRLGWKQNLPVQDYVMAGQIWLEMPTGTYEDATGLRTGYDAWAIIPSINVGNSWDKMYVYGSFAYGLRTNNYSHFNQVNLELGYNVWHAISAALYFDWLNALNNGSRIDPVNNLRTGLYVNNQEYFAWGLKIFGKALTEQTGFSLGLAGAFSGNYVPRAPAFNLALFHKF